MARIRTIKPEFFISDTIAELQPLDRLLFIGLWTQADRLGRLEDRPRRIKVALLPYDDHNIEEALDRLQSKTFITRYSANGNNYIEINNFLKHQCPNIKESTSTIPAQCKAHSGISLLRKGKEGKGRERKGKEKGLAQIDSPDKLQTNFETFWKAYPKKKSKGQAESAFNKINPSEQLLATMLAKIEQAKTSEDWTKQDGKYIPYPATWLNAKGWEDEETEVSQGHQPVSKFSTGTLQWLRKKEAQKKEKNSDGQGQ